MIESHFHPQYFQDILTEVILEAKNMGVKRFIGVAVDFNDFTTLPVLAAQHPDLYFSLGVHPLSDTHPQFNTASLQINELNPKWVAIGEVGLDYYHESSTDHGTQLKLFKMQMKLAAQYDKPVIIHTRDAFDDTILVLREFPQVKGIMHCFTGTLPQALACIELGYYISFSGIVTFKNASHLQHVALNIPLDKILIETDSPYLTPDYPPYSKRGSYPNRPKNLLCVASKLAELMNLPLETIQSITYLNTCSILNLHD